MQKFKAIKTNRGQWCSYGGHWFATGKNDEVLLDRGLVSEALDAVKREVGEPCHLVDVLVIERGELPNKHDLLSANGFIARAFDRSIPWHEKHEEALLAVKKMLLQLAEMAG